MIPLSKLWTFLPRILLHWENIPHKNDDVFLGVELIFAQNCIDEFVWKYQKHVVNIKQYSLSKMIANI